ncbi:MAG: hypothetical protein JO272_07670 [Pseudonocardiales bacterium]|nr:hypothetical protein [Pseudonocardiales bacterium]
MTPLLTDSQQALALAVSRGDATAWQAADRTFLELDERRKKLYEAIKILQETGHLDRIPVDAKLMIDSYFGTITGSPQGHLAIAGGNGSDDTWSMPDEDDLAE